MAVISYYVMMPITFGSLPFNILYFIAGIVARNNQWLTENLPQLKASTVVSARILTVICFLIWLSLFTYFYIIDFGNGLLPKKGASECADDNDNDMDMNVYIFALIMCGIAIFAGFYCTTVSLTLMHFAQTYWNFSNGVCKFLSSAAYAVYIIHPYVICTVTWSFVKLLEYFEGITLVFCKDDVMSMTHFGHNYLVWVAWIYVVSLTLIIVWPLAWCIKQLPGLNRML